MPITIEIERAISLTVFTATGVLNFDEVISAVKSFYDGETTQNVIWDLQEVSEIPFSPEEVHISPKRNPPYWL